MDIKQKYNELKELSLKAELNWIVQIKETTLQDHSALYSEAPMCHTFALGNNYKQGDLAWFVAKAKVNESAQSNLSNLDVSLMSTLQDAQEKLFVDITNILIEYWAFNEYISLLEPEVMRQKMQDIEHFYQNLLNGRNNNPLQMANAYLKLDRTDSIKSDKGLDSFSLDLIQKTKEYGQSPHSLHYVVEFYNAFKFPSKATIVGESKILLVSQASSSRVA